MLPLLPIHPLPLPLESAIGYLLRLGAVNDLPTLPWLQAFQKRMDLPAQSLEAFFEQTTGHGATEMNCLWGPSIPTLPINPERKLGIKTTYWNLHHRRWCPDCLRESGYWKTEWLLTLQVACPAHRRLLHELCPACQQPVSWYSGGLHQCRCDHSLTTAAPMPTSAELCQVAQLISEKFAAATETPFPAATSDLAHLLEDVQLPRLLDLLWVLGCYGHFRSLKKSLKVQDHHRLAVALPVLESAGHMLTQWPHAFHALLSDSCDQTQTHALHLYKFTGPRLLALNRALSHPELHFVRHEFERFISAHWKGVIGERHRFSEAITADHATILAKEAAETLGISRKKLNVLVDQGHIQGWYQQSKGSLRYLVVDRKSVLRFQRGSADALHTLAEAADYLGLSHPRLKLLVEAGLLAPLRQPEGDNAQHLHWAFEKSELDRVLGDLRIQVHATPACSSVISLEAVCRSRSRTGADFITLIRAIQRGELDCIARDPSQPGLKGLLLGRTQFETWFAEHLQSQQLYSISPAAHYLGLKEHVLSWLRDKGLLYGFEYPEGAKSPKLPRPVLDSLKARYAWGLELERLTGYGRKSAARALINRGVWPVTGPAVDGGTTYLFLRADVIAFQRHQAQYTRHGSHKALPCKAVGGGGHTC
ncbi:TniQ family protein [Crenobacter cavernae]|uniref:TniQ domain-containing protein n=1 Tax=Crenobacter cavernae TaxID=2290923 RepID=A0A345Y2H6_9NEIS|nr:TniQ family protein [Crenobacter cavernae]AXK38128.1 hypothetical protein DWG20_01045 [Crenobacter cavernae]